MYPHRRVSRPTRTDRHTLINPNAHTNTRTQRVYLCRPIISAHTQAHARIDPTYTRAHLHATVCPHTRARTQTRTHAAHPRTAAFVWGVPVRHLLRSDAGSAASVQAYKPEVGRVVCAAVSSVVCCGAVVCGPALDLVIEYLSS